MSWYVYLFKLEKSHYFKIGHTANVKSRLNAINTASPHKIELVTSWEFARAIKA